MGMKKLFDNPKPVVYVICLFVAMMLLLFSIESRGEAKELYFDAGSAIVRGETPVIGLNIVWEGAGPKNTDFELGFKLIGESTYNQDNSNQFVVHGMLVDGWKDLEAGMGFAYFNSKSEYNCQTTFSLLLRYNISSRWHVQAHHFSTAGSCKPNPGRDLLTFGYRF